jgi:FkbM family methyltransferase
MSSRTTLTLVDGVRIVVPDSLELITPYVLREQEDWFEDEIKFLRRVLRPGQTAIDIGANYGVYTASIARAVGPTGSVWAFEPATETASYLTETIAANAFTNVVLEQSALSRAPGTATLSLTPHAELNTLVRGAAHGSASETVRLVTLNDCMTSYGWQQIDFVKIDAEGEELNILEGGGKFFASQSPLVQYEIKEGKVVHLELLEAFRKLGYASYQLVPGLDALVPFRTDSAPDGFLLNLFCCKDDQAVRLAARGHLLREKDLAKTWKDRVSGLTGAPRGDWQQMLARMPYSRNLAPAWKKTVEGGESRDVERALSDYALSREVRTPLAMRWRALEACFKTLAAICASEPTYLRLASLARVARDWGAREVAADALSRLCNAIFRDRQCDPTEPFLAPGSRFDTLNPGESMADWVLACALEELERLSTFSSFYTGVASKPRLEAIRELGFASPEVQRRLALVNQRFSLA